jgi:parallel beta-helix repeat protein
VSTLSKFTPTLVTVAVLVGCGEDPPCDECDAYVTDDNDDDFEAIQTMLTEAEEGDVLYIAEGTYELDRELILSRDGVTILGAGRDATILDFSSQDAETSGANGLKVTSDDVTVESFQVRNTPGDGIRFENATGVTFRDIYVTWQDPEPSEHGAYGIYPVG